MALASNRSLAERNLDMKPKLERERERLVERYSELEEVRDRYKQRCTLRGKQVLKEKSGLSQPIPLFCKAVEGCR